MLGHLYVDLEPMGTQKQQVHEVKSLNSFLNNFSQSEEQNEVLGGRSVADLIPDVINGTRLEHTARILSDRAVCHLNENPLCGGLSTCSHCVWWQCGLLFV